MYNVDHVAYGEVDGGVTRTIWWRDGERRGRKAYAHISDHDWLSERNEACGT